MWARRAARGGADAEGDDAAWERCLVDPSADLRAWASAVSGAAGVPLDAFWSPPGSCFALQAAQALVALEMRGVKVDLL